MFTLVTSGCSLCRLDRRPSSTESETGNGVMEGFRGFPRPSTPSEGVLLRVGVETSGEP